MRKAVNFSITDIANILKRRQKNQFDGNLAVSGDRGNGKSHLISKIFYKLGNFNPWKQQVYESADIKKLLITQIKGKCFDDEAINSGYKRNFQDKGQQEIIKILTNYRDNFNIHASAIPNFFALDKDLRDLIFLHIHVIERGLAVVHLPLQGRLYTQDRWDAKNNAKIEQNWNNKLRSNFKFKIPYHKLSTFAGYLYCTDLTEKQTKLYKEVKRTKRAEVYEKTKPEDKEQTFLEQIYTQLLEGKMTKEFLLQLCLFKGKKWSNVNSSINVMLKDRGIKETLKDFLLTNEKEKNNNQIDMIKTSVPQF